MFEKNKKKLLFEAKQNGAICPVCGKPLDLSIKHPSPDSVQVDHIIPVSLGGTSHIENLQLVHFKCNRLKSDKLEIKKQTPEEGNRRPPNRDLPLIINWLSYRSEEEETKNRSFKSRLYADDLIKDDI